MVGIFEHIKFERETNFTERRTKGGGSNFQFKGHPKEHSQKLQNDIANVKENR